MILIQERYLFTESFTLSRLYNEDKFICYILEDRVREPYTNSDRTYEYVAPDKWKKKCETAIGVGTYNVVIDMSTRFKKLMMHLLGVDGFDGIRVHSGRSNHDTEGCLITGKERNEVTGEVSGSIIARDIVFKLVDDALKRKEEVLWSIRGLIPPNTELPYKVSKSDKLVIGQ